MNKFPPPPPPDVSWMWHGSTNRENLNHFSGIYPNPSPREKEIMAAAGSAYRLGFRNALRMLEEMGIIQMQDINREANSQDQEKWHFHTKETE